MPLISGGLSFLSGIGYVDARLLEPDATGVPGGIERNRMDRNSEKVRPTMRWYDFFFGSSVIESKAGDAGRALLRIGSGLALALGHGLGKIPPSSGFIERVGEMGFPVPGLFAWLSGLAEFGAGLLLAVGLATRPAALFIALNMTVVVLVAHAGDPFGNRERGFLFLAVVIFYLLAGAGRYSFDHVIARRPLLTTRI